MKSVGRLIERFLNLRPGDTGRGLLLFAYLFVVMSSYMAARIARGTGWPASRHRYANWLGVECPSVHAAVWMMRALVVSNVLSRREGTALFVPVNPASDPAGDRAVDAFVRTHRLATARGVL